MQCCGRLEAGHPGEWKEICRLSGVVQLKIYVQGALSNIHTPHTHTHLLSGPNLSSHSLTSVQEGSANEISSVNGVQAIWCQLLQLAGLLVMLQPQQAC